MVVQEDWKHVRVCVRMNYSCGPWLGALNLNFNKLINKKAPSCSDGAVFFHATTTPPTGVQEYFSMEHNNNFKKKKTFQPNQVDGLTGSSGWRGSNYPAEGNWSLWKEAKQVRREVKCNFAIFTTKMQKGNKDLLTKRASHFAPHRMLCTTGAHLAAAQTSERKTAKKAFEMITAES